MFIAYGGMIRGAIAFALVMKIPHVGSPDCKVPDFCFAKEEYDLAVSTTLALVMITTLLFGTFMKAASKWLTGESTPANVDTELKPIKVDSGRKTMGGKSAHTAYKSMMSHYEELIHPNLEKGGNEDSDDTETPDGSSTGPKAFKDSDFVKWFLKFDAEVIMPLFVRNYNKYIIKETDALAEVLNENFSDEDIDVISERMSLITKIVTSRNSQIQQFELESARNKKS